MSDKAKHKRTLVTSALPYANGDIHLGHLVEYIMTDIYVRYLKMAGHEVNYMWAADVHGSPIELKALELGMKPEELAEHFRQRHATDFAGFQIEPDIFYTTHSEETKKHSYAIYEEAKERGLIYTKEVEGLYSEVDGRFLPDRWIKGTCPKCKAEDQYGDSCEVCGVTYRPSEMIDPRSAISGDTPVPKKTMHYFYKLSDPANQQFLKEWVNEDDRMPHATREFVNEWLEGGLRDWDISREEPYFGFLIPGETDKYFYVWLDAPVGYIGATDKWCQENGKDVNEYWKSDETRIVHVIGKDIVYFHCLFWPAMLKNASYNLPSRVQVHGFLTVNGEKMSKSRGTFINARTYLNHLDPQYLRYYYASKQRPEPDDLDLNLGKWEDPEDPETLDASHAELVDRVNAELVNKLANLASRVIPFTGKNLEGKLGALPTDVPEELLTLLSDERKEKLAAAYEAFDFAQVTREVAEMADLANKYFQDAQPWKVIKEDQEAARAICTLTATHVKILTGLVKPIVPVYAEKIEEALAVESITWENMTQPLEGHTLGKFKAPVVRVDPENVKAMVLESRQSLGAAKDASTLAEPIKEEITFDDFAKVDLRVAVIKEAGHVKGADKLLQLTVDIGEGKTRNIFAGIKKYYDPEKLVGRRIIVVANLKPRKMKFGLSEGMLLAATDGDDVLLLGTDGEADPGSTVG